MFSEVPGRYDLVNRILTFGLDAVWRQKAIRACCDGVPRSVLDLCTGTGDFAVGLSRNLPGGTKIIGLDFSEGMLALAIEKHRRHGGIPVGFLRADAASLPFPDASFDRVAVSFAFRNLIWKNPGSSRHLSEILRVLKPDGRLVVVETSQPRSAFVRSLFRLYLRQFVGPVGGALSGRKSAYAYLAGSAEAFHSTDKLESLLKTAGFRAVESTPLLFGAASIIVATV
jgi:demethylmenaquinone methyltransferase/2-methoxy-6-polyprenyl-1,4-benzoquinol methylase